MEPRGQIFALRLHPAVRIAAGDAGVGFDHFLDLAGGAGGTSASAPSSAEAAAAAGLASLFEAVQESSSAAAHSRRFFMSHPVPRCSRK